jgi:hypothetical protein
MTAITATPQTLEHRGLDIGRVFKQAWRLFVDDIGALVIGALIACILSVLTVGILAGPLVAGLYGMVVGRVRDGRRPEVGDVFGQFDRVGAFIVAGLVLIVLIGLASLTIVGGVLLATIWLYVIPLMVDRGMGLGEAMKTSKDMVVAGGFWQHLALVIVFAVIASIDKGIVGVLTTPFMIVAVSAAYYLTSGREDALERA